MFLKKKIAVVVSGATLLVLQVGAVHGAEGIEEIEVFGITPGAAARQSLRKIPYAVRSAGFADLETVQALDVSDFLNSRLGSININSAQNNPLQADVQFRGFTASPLLGLPQGLSVYQNGVRINEPLGDAVNWDLVPESAVYGMELLSGSNPVFGLNTLGGALSLTMKDGFNFIGNQAEVSGGSWGRMTGSVESGGNNGTWGYYVNLSHFSEDGWRDLSESDAQNFYGTLSWRDAERSTLDLTYQQGDSELFGNGALPIGQLALQRDVIFTGPDITNNDLQMFDVRASHRLNDVFQVSGNAFWRQNTTDSFNGDGADFELCEFAGGAQALFDDPDEIEDALEDDLDIELDDICEGEEDDIRDYDDLEELIEEAALAAGLDPEDFEIDNVTDDLSGTGTLSDEAINNLSRREQESSGLSGQLLFAGDLFARPTQFVAGYSWFKGESAFDAVVELAELDPVTRSTLGLGTGLFLDDAATDIHTETETASVYFTNTMDLTSELALTLSGRYNDTDVTLRDRSGERPELNGDHNFARFNPALGLTWSPDQDMTLYASYSESSRVPTPIELACNEGVFELARQYASEAGEDPDDIEFECRLPNAFLADPPLDEVVTSSVETGMRMLVDDMRFSFGLFSTTNRDDILFQTTGRSTGLFANVDKTRRMGIETELTGIEGALAWYVSYSHIAATFEDDFDVLSPNHPNANADGELRVQRGDHMPGMPENIFKVGGDFSITPAASVGAELIYNSDQVLRGDEANRLDKIGGYTLVNLRASYLVAERFTVFARVTNALDKEYENFGLLGEDPTEILPDLADARPLFLGVGAPRAAWIGAALRF